MNECMVSIICTAYNHERYIKQSIEGFLMQETSFEYEILINDDASTDCTAKIIKEYENKYPLRIRAFYQKTNLYSKGVRVSNYLIKHARGKYIAFCEGDDFWVDKKKLQKQIDFMEANDHCSLTIHAGYYAYEDGVLERILFQHKKSDSYISVEELIANWIAPTASVVYRNSARKELDIPFIGDIKLGDYPLLIYLGLNGLVYFFSEPMCVYRRGSVSSVSRAYANEGVNQIRHNEQMIKLLERIDDFTKRKYKIAILDAKERRMFSIFQIKKDYNQIRNSSVYHTISNWSKIKLYMEIKCPVFNNIRNMINKARCFLKYYRDRLITRLCDIPNIVILDKVKK